MKSGKKVPSNLKESLDRSRHFVSPETEQHVAVPVDENHAVVGEQSLEGDGRVEGVGETNHSDQSLQFTRKHGVLADPDKGGEDARDVKTSRVTLGRHVSSDDGLDVAAKRSAFLKKTKKEAEKAHEARRQSSSTT